MQFNQNIIVNSFWMQEQVSTVLISTYLQFLASSQCTQYTSQCSAIPSMSFFLLFIFLFFYPPATSLVHLCKLRDPETQRLSLQTLELLAIENSDVIIQHVNCCFDTTCIYSPNSVHPKEDTLAQINLFFFFSISPSNFRSMTCLVP